MALFATLSHRYFTNCSDGDPPGADCGGWFIVSMLFSFLQLLAVLFYSRARHRQLQFRIGGSSTELVSAPAAPFGYPRMADRNE